MDKIPYWQKHKVDIPEGTEGRYRVEKFTVSEEEASFQNARSTFSFTDRGMNIHPGTYTRLMRGGTIVMSDTPSEIRDHMAPIHHARGNVLIAGLGIGMVTSACLAKPEVDKVTVVDISPEVIHLVGDHLKGIHGDRLEIVEADIMAWKPPKGARYDVAWFDIWDDICTDNLDQMATLNRRFARRTDWKGCWKEEELKYHKRRERRSGW